MRSKMASDLANLPTFVLAEILSYFNLTERLQISSVCKKFRETIWFLQFWKDVSLNCVIDSKTHHQLSRVAFRFTSKLSLRLNPNSCFSVQEFLNVLKIISANRQLQCLLLKPSTFRVEWPERMQHYGIDE